jgi:hypothetical protein
MGPTVLVTTAKRPADSASAVNASDNSSMLICSRCSAWGPQEPLRACRPRGRSGRKRPAPGLTQVSGAPAWREHRHRAQLGRQGRLESSAWRVSGESTLAWVSSLSGAAPVSTLAVSNPTADAFFPYEPAVTLSVPRRFTIGRLKREKKTVGLVKLEQDLRCERRERQRRAVEARGAERSSARPEVSTRQR